MTKKHTSIPFEPEEFPISPENPEIRQPTDPGEPDIPEEAPENIPNEVPDEQAPQPEVNPDEFEK